MNKIQKLCDMASKLVGVKESGKNKGKMVEEFQKAVDGKAQGEPWCMAFVQYCIKKSDEFGGDKSWLFKTEHVLTCWNKSPREARLNKPEVGSVIIWNYYKNGKPTSSGHTGIVEKIIDSKTMITIEGNTGDGSAINREGDGVYRRKRMIGNSGSFVLLGYLKPWKNPVFKIESEKPKENEEIVKQKSFTKKDKELEIEVIPEPKLEPKTNAWENLINFFNRFMPH
jgi:hypothetical protein